jgi:hypothetical protein
VPAEAAGFAEFAASRERALQRSAWLLTGDWAGAGRQQHPPGLRGCGLRTRYARNNRVVPEMDPDAVIESLARDSKLKPFVRDGRIGALPARLTRRRELLDAVAQAFEPGVRYSEQGVDSFLRRLHDDHAALRRYLVDEEFLGRGGGDYWRIGGSTPGSWNR